MECVRLITWNVNGLRSILRKNFAEFVATYRPDVLCLQETRVDASTCPSVDGFRYVFFNHCESKKGYAGTAIFSQYKPLKTRCLDADAQHPEGRMVIAEFKKFFLINTYVPNAQADLGRLSYRVHLWDATLRALLQQLDRQKPVLWCGDLNVAHEPIDLAHPESNHLSAGFTDEERQSFSQSLAMGLVDVFRFLHPNLPHQYTWWSYRMQARQKNVGWRIDYFVASKALLPAIASCEILSDVGGSDHAPVALQLDRQWME